MIWFPLARGGTAACAWAATGHARAFLPGTEHSNPVARESLNAKRGAPVPAPRGVERLSEKDRGGSPRDARRAAQRKSPDDKKVRKQRASDIGRALRTIYDDTLRESVPDDFSDLLGKLT